MLGGLSYEFLDHEANIPYIDVIFCVKDVFLKAHEFLRLKFLTYLFLYRAPEVVSHMLHGAGTFYLHLSLLLAMLNPDKPNVHIFLGGFYAT